jgi:arylsulfatase A-like enzyme
MEVYAAMIDRMDQGIGKVIDQLKRSGDYGNTVILYLQDNGGCAEGMGRTGNKNHPNIPRPNAPTLPAMKSTDFAVAVSVPSQTRDGYPVRMGPKVMPGGDDTYVWPAGIAARGELRTQAGHLIDIAATLQELGQAEYPIDATPLEGRSLVPAFANHAIEREAIYWEHEGNRAVRKGDWKLVAKHGGSWELYDIRADRTESKDLSTSKPEIVADLVELYEKYAARTLVAPWPLPKTRSDGL